MRNDEKEISVNNLSLQLSLWEDIGDIKIDELTDSKISVLFRNQTVNHRRNIYSSLIVLPLGGMTRLEKGEDRDYCCFC